MLEAEWYDEEQREGGVNGCRFDNHSSQGGVLAAVCVSHSSDDLSPIEEKSRYNHHGDEKIKTQRHAVVGKSEVDTSCIPWGLGSGAHLN